EQELERIKTAACKPHGMILVTGPTGSGKTTTLYSTLAFLDSPEKNITTVEDPVEYQVYGINQVHIRENVGLTFPVSLRSILRQDPDIIMVGEIRDGVTMDIAIKAALTGHLVLSTLHTNDACGSIIRITNMGIEPFLIASTVLMVSAQRLIRQLCPECKESFVPNEKLLSDLGRTPQDGVLLYRAVGCENCRGSGYRGRTVITEVLTLTLGIRELIMKKETADVIKQAARREGMTTLRESGINKVFAGVSTLDEVFRVTAADQPLK
ncbi:MAG: GspE/PulE family protein, partial [Candidatus Omnitrophica bacterium]|nr:GspE/PulE family protein [Candidatus Omnitrophota bacterium]